MWTLLITSTCMKPSLSFTRDSGAQKALHFRFLQPGRHSKEIVTGCLLWFLLQPPAARSCQESHTPPSARPVTAILTCCSFLARIWKGPRDNRSGLPTSRRGRNSQDEPTAFSFPRRDRGHFPARLEPSQEPGKHLYHSPESSVSSISFSRSHGHKLIHEKLHPNTRNNFFTRRAAEHWNRLPRGSRSSVPVSLAPGDPASAGGLYQMISRGPFQR